MRDYIVSEDVSIKEAMSYINSNEYQIVFAVDKEGVLKGSLTDGDVRRYLIKSGRKKEDSMSLAMHTGTAFGRTYAEAKAKLCEFRCVPIVDKGGRPMNLLTKKGLIPKGETNIPVVIQAGGLGTRLYPYTQILPKPLMPVGEVPIVERIIDKFAAWGCRRFYVIVNYKKNMIKAYFGERNKDVEIEFVDEDKPLGTGGGLYMLDGKIEGNFFLTNCDMLLDVDYAGFYAAHKSAGNLITMICADKKVSIPYGVVDLDEKGDISKITEKPSFRFLTNTGMYVVNSAVLKDIEPNVPIGFPTVFDNVRLRGDKVGVYQVEDPQWMDMGQLEEYREVLRNWQE